MKRSMLLLAVLTLAGGALWAQKEVPAQTEFVYSAGAYDLEFNPRHSYTASEAQIFTGLYEGLFSYDPETLEPLPAACGSYEVSKDGKTYTFHIREKAKWSDGTRVLARDFRNSWLKMVSPEEKAEYSSLFDIIKGVKDFRLGVSKDPASVGIRAVSDTVLEVVLESPAAYFTRLVCHHSFTPVNEKMDLVADWKALGSGIISNGPYRVSSLDKESLFMEKNPHYWDSGAVKLPSIRVLFTDDDAGTTQKYNNGEIHWIAGGFMPDRILDRSAVQYNPMFATHYYYFSCANPVWADERLRRALCLLLPWNEIRSNEVYLFLAQSLIFPIKGYPEVKGITERDEAGAMKLLAEAGYEGGKGLPEIVVRISEGEDQARIAELMKSYWEKAGMGVRVDKVESQEYFPSLKKGDYTIGSSTWIGDFADPLTFLQMWTSDSNLNDAKFRNEAFEALIKKSMGQEGTVRYKTLAEAEQILLNCGEVLPIYHSLAVNVIDPTVIGGWYENALDIHPFKALFFSAFKSIPGVVMLER